MVQKSSVIRVVTIVLSITIVFGVLAFMLFSGILFPPNVKTYNIGGNTDTIFYTSPNYLFADIVDRKKGENQIKQFNKEMAEKISALVRSFDNQKITIIFSPNESEVIFIPWGKMYFYPEYYTNSASKFKYTCDNYTELYKELKEILNEYPSS